MEFSESIGRPSLTETLYFAVDATICVIGMISCFYMAVEYRSWKAAVLSGCFEYKLGLLAHEACHGAIPKIYGFLYELGLGSQSYWIQKHNHGHHRHTNGRDDPDIRLQPYLRLAETQPWRWYHRYQHYYEIFLFPVAALSLRLNSLWHVYGSMSVSSPCPLSWRVTTLHAIAVGFFVVWPVFRDGLLGLCYYAIQNVVVGCLYGVLFSVSHVNDRTDMEPVGLSPRERQLATTADWASGSVVWNYATGGLNHQVIHHLHPYLSSYHYPSMAKNYKNHSSYRRFTGLWEAWASHRNRLYALGNP